MTFARRLTPKPAAIRAFARQKSRALVLATCFAAALPVAASAQGEGPKTVPAVVVAPVVMKSVGQAQQFTGRIEAVQSVDIQARVEGYLTKVDFKEGSNVKLDDVLYQIDPAPYEASLAQAKAHLASAQANVAQGQASLKNAEVNLDRQQTLLKRDTVSQATVDDATASRDEAAAQVQAAQAQVEEAKAQVQTAQLNLSYTTLKAPIAGRIGKTAVTIGNLITPSSGTMATLVQLDPIRVAFSVPDVLYTTLIQNEPKAGTTGRADVGQPLFQPQLQLPNGNTYDKPGTISFVSNEIDASTGTITAYADFPNPSAVLLPGAFVVVTVEETAKKDQAVIPGSAVLQDRDGAYVFVLDNNDTVATRRITIAQRSASDVVVSKGLAEGETVVVQGLQKIRPGQKVSPTSAQTAAASPSPSDSSATTKQ